MKIKVLHVINSLTVGGAETLLANSLAEGGLEEYSENVVAYFQGTSFLEKRIDKRIKIYCLGYKGILSLPGTLLKLRRIIKEEKIDIVHSHLNPADFYTHLICPVPQVHTSHTTYSMDTETTKSKLYLEKKLFFTRRKCNLIHLSEYTKNDLLQSIPFKGKSFVLNNFIPDKFFSIENKGYKSANKSLKLIAVGRLNAGKNFMYLLETFKFLKDVNIELDIYGYGEMEDYNTIIKEFQIKVRMMGGVSDIATVLNNYDLFIMPSKFEGFPLSVFEAMAAGLPLLLSNIDPLKSIVHDNAIYFELDNEKALANIIRSIYSGNIDINSLAVKGKEYAEITASKKKYIAGLLDIYGKILKDSNR